jgi:hypothetical protein
MLVSHFHSSSDCIEAGAPSLASWTPTVTSATTATSTTTTIATIATAAAAAATATTTTAAATITTADALDVHPSTSFAGTSHRSRAGAGCGGRRDLGCRRWLVQA